MSVSDPGKLNWYVAYVKSCSEFKVAEFLEKFGYEYYLPVKREVHQWSDRKKIVRKLVLPRMIFVHTTEFRRRKSLEEIPYLYRYMAKDGPYTAEVIPDRQMDAFRMMVEYDGRNLNFSAENFAPGDKVRVTSGPLKGMECELINVSGTRCLAVRLGVVGTATMDLGLDTVEKI